MGTYGRNCEEDGGLEGTHDSQLRPQDVGGRAHGHVGSAEPALPGGTRRLAWARPGVGLRRRHEVNRMDLLLGAWCPLPASFAANCLLPSVSFGALHSACHRALG